MQAPSATQEVWAELFVDALGASGVTDVVLSPGSRSTPLVVVLAEQTRIRVHDVIDERAAAFVALGMARATGVPTAVLCTSGSAPTHYFPALVEAEASGIPLVVLSADRPLSMQRAGESQTIDQVKLFGDRVRFFADLGEPSARSHDLRAMRRIVAQAVFTTIHPTPGPVHLDLRFVKPLEPVAPADEDAATAAHRALGRSIIARGAPRFFASADDASEEAVTALAQRIARAARPVVVVGPSLAPRRGVARSLPPALARLASASSAPVFVDATSNVRFGEHAARFSGSLDALLRSAEVRAELAPDLVVQIGRAPVATGYAKLLTDVDVDVVLVDEHAFLDPFARASMVVRGPRASTLERVAAELERVNGGAGHAPAFDAAWATTMVHLDAYAVRTANELAARGSDALAEASVARALVAAIPATGRLVLGNSLAVREVDGWVAPIAKPIEVDAQRGASGIDGLVAGFVGACLATDRPSALLLGDVSLAHDLGSLVLLRRLGTPAVVVVVDNGGGRIFEQLPVASRVPSAMTHFTTAPEVDFVAVARALGLEARSCSTLSELRSTLDEAFGAGRATLVRCVVPPHGAYADNAALFAAVDAEASATVLRAS